MIPPLITTLATALVIAVILIPLVAFLAAMLFEGARQNGWGEIRRATRLPFVSEPLQLPLQRGASIGAGGLGARRVSAAPHDDA